MAKFDPLEPFANEGMLKEVLDELRNFEYKLYGKIPLRLHRGNPTKYEFDVTLGVVHFTEEDFQRLSVSFARMNEKWGSQMTFCIYPSKGGGREIILNVRGSPKAPSEID